MLRRTLKFIIILIFLLGVSDIYAQQQNNANNQTGNKKQGVPGNPVEKVLIDFAKLPDYLSIDKWQIILSGYSDNPLSRSLSDLKIVPVDAAKLSIPFKFNNALGIHVYFEYSHGNDWAQIRPRLEINPFYAKEGEGIVRNVGPIKSISMWVSGRNYNYSIEVRLVDQNGKYKGINFGTLWFKGWKKLTWVNPDYIKDVNKRDITKVHLYPQYAPYLKFDSIIIYKSPQEIGGDFVTYIKDIRVEYEPLLKKLDMPVNDEKIWKIQETTAAQKLKRLDRWLNIKYSGSSYEEQYKKDRAEMEKNLKSGQSQNK